MSVETVLAVVASSFGVVMGAAPALQIRRMLAERSSRDVSIGYFAIIAFGSVLWGSYGVSLGNLAIVIPNVVGFLAAVVTVLVARRLRRQERPSWWVSVMVMSWWRRRSVRLAGNPPRKARPSLPVERNAC